jgi:hypothetical protein
LLYYENKRKKKKSMRQLPEDCHLQNFPLIHLPEGFEIEKVAEGLTYPTSVMGDSRFNGPIPLRSIKGKATYVLYSSTFSRIGEKLK